MHKITSELRGIPREIRSIGFEPSNSQWFLTLSAVLEKQHDTAIHSAIQDLQDTIRSTIKATDKAVYLWCWLYDDFSRLAVLLGVWQQPLGPIVDLESLCLGFKNVTQRIQSMLHLGVGVMPGVPNCKTLASYFRPNIAPLRRIGQLAFVGSFCHRLAFFSVEIRPALYRNPTQSDTKSDKESDKRDLGQEAKRLESPTMPVLRGIADVQSEQEKKMAEVHGNRTHRTHALHTSQRF